MSRKVKVRITKLAGETGLRLPGSTMLLTSKQAKSFSERGLVEIEKPKPTKKPK
jgi:hypothetical protein